MIKDNLYMPAYALFLTIFSILGCYGQSSQGNSIHPLKIGDSIPELLFEKMVNYKGTTAKLSDFEGKAILLDFWATWCVPCVRTFPKLEVLQREYAGDLQIILASSDKESSIRSFYTKKKDLILPTAIFEENSDVLPKLFPHVEIPHYVWISKDRKIYSITDASQINETTVKNFINGNQIKLDIKNDSLEMSNLSGTVIDSIEKRSGIINAISISPNLVYQSMLSKYDPRLTGVLSTGREGFKNRILECVNSSILGLIQVSQGILSSADRWKVFLDIKDSTLLYPKDAGKRKEWIKQHGYSYRVILNKPDSALRFKIMQRDLETVFGMKVSYQKKKVPCLALTFSGEQGTILAKGSQRGYVSSTVYSIDVVNQPISSFIKALWKQEVGLSFMAKEQIKIPIIDKTNILGNIDLKIDNINNIKDLEDVNSKLASAGLKLTLENRELDMLVISDR